MSRYILSLIYLVWGTLAAIGFIAFFARWPQPFLSLFFLAIPFYFATISFLIFAHPIIVSAVLLKMVKNKQRIKPVAIHLCWSMTITGVFVGMVMNGYIITA